MAYIFDRLLRRRRRALARYEEDKETFEKVIGRPSIEIRVELPEGYEGLKKEFLELEKDEAFIKAVTQNVNKIVKMHLEKRETR